MTPLFENPPPIIADEIRRVVPPDDEILIQVKSDVGRDGRFGKPWVIVTPRRFALIGDGEESLHVPLNAIRRARAEAIIGGGRLIIERNGEPAMQIPYTNSLVHTFGEVAVNRYTSTFESGYIPASTPTSATGTARKKPRRPLAMAGSTPATWASLTRTGICTSSTGRKT